MKWSPCCAVNPDRPRAALDSAGAAWRLTFSLDCSLQNLYKQPTMPLRLHCSGHACRRSFYNVASLNQHQASCKNYKARYAITPPAPSWAPKHKKTVAFVARSWKQLARPFHVCHSVTGRVRGLTLSAAHQPLTGCGLHPARGRPTGFFSCSRGSKQCVFDEIKSYSLLT